jgi:PmbA protein
MSDLSKPTSLILEECKRLEPCLAEVCADEISETKVVYENTDFSVASSSQTAVLGLRVIVGNKLGFITTNNFDENELKLKAKEAQMVARLSPESIFHEIAPAEKNTGSFAMCNENLANVSAAQMLRWTDILVNEARKDPRICLDRAELSVMTTTRLIQNSHGVSQRVKQAICTFFIMGMAKVGDEVTSFDYEANNACVFDEIESKIMATAKGFRGSVLGSLGATGAKSYKGLVLFHPAAVGSLIAELVGFNVNARSQQDGMSQWAKALGTQVASTNFSLSEDPLDVSRPGEWSPFDREGVLTEKHDIIKNGVLNFTAHNAFTAKRAKARLTGNATGGARSMPSIGLHALTIHKGNKTLDELNSALNTGLVLKRFSGNSDPVSGNFSGVAKNSWWVENGKGKAPLKEVMISGNVFELIKNIKLVGSENFRQMGSFDSPYLLIDGVSVTSS